MIKFYRSFHVKKNLRVERNSFQENDVLFHHHDKTPNTQTGKGSLTEI